MNGNSPGGLIWRKSAPNPRVQRTRSSPSALHAPLTRHPLGGPSSKGRRSVAWVAALLTIGFCGVAHAEDTPADSCRSIVPQSLAKALKVRFPSHRLPRASDSSDEDIAYNREHGGNGCLGAAPGDYDGDGQLDLALIMRPEGQGKMLVVAALARKQKWRITTLTEFDFLGGLFVERGEPRKYERSEVVDAEGEGFRPGELRSYTSPTPCVITGKTEAWSFAYCLGPKGWINVWLSD